MVIGTKSGKTATTRRRMVATTTVKCAAVAASSFAATFVSVHTMDLSV